MIVQDIAEIDKNFAGEKIEYEGLKTYDAKEKPFELYGLYKVYEDGDYKRMPPDVAEPISKQLRSLYRHTSGARMRFRTDSTRIVLHCFLPSLYKGSHMPRTGSSCFDLYVDGEYFNVFRPERNTAGVRSEIEKTDAGYESGYKLGEKKMRDILINFPLYNKVSEVYIALDEDAVIEAPREYTHTKPVVFYGSSITQGGCASHPGNSYPLILSRRLDTDIMNLGFSDGARGEDEMAEYLADLDMSVLVYDYDHNAQSVEHLQETHEKMFQTIRKKQPNLPVIMISAADLHNGEEITSARRNIIKATYEHAVQSGDKNVYFIDGSEIYTPVGREYCTVDDSHPNDVGFLMMANAVEKVLGPILNPQIKAVIFDCDGTLLDSERIFMSTWNLVGKPMGYEVPIEVLRDTRGKGASYGRKRLLEVMGGNFPIDEINEKRKVLNEELFCAAKDVVKPGVKELLTRLRQQGISTAVASAKPSKMTSDHLKHAGIYDYFDVVMGGDTVKRNKPEPDLFLKAAEELGVDSQNCMVIGDAAADMTAANAAGMRSVFVPDLVPVDDEIRKIAWKILERIDEIIRYM